MKFLIDAQLPKSLAMLMQRHGFDALHTTDLPNGNHTSDAEIIQFADEAKRVVITKDIDFVQSHLLSGCPGKLIIIATGNIKNSMLLQLFKNALPTIVEALATIDYLEIDQKSIIFHTPKSQNSE